MTAIETLERAISKLEELRDGHSGYGSHPWHAESHEGSNYATQVISADGYAVPGCFNCGDNEGIYEGTDAELIVALSRTVEPMLTLLRLAVEFAGITPNRYVDAALVLARAILGEENDHGV